MNGKEILAWRGRVRNLATPAFKGSPNHLQSKPCMSSPSCTTQQNHKIKINEMPTRHRSGCPEGARNPASRTMSLRFTGSFVTGRNHFTDHPSSHHRFFSE